MKSNQDRILAFCIPKPNEDFHAGGFTYRHITTKEYLDLYEHVSNRKPVYLFNSPFEIKDYYLTSIITKYRNDFTDVTVCLSFFMPNIHEAALSEYHYYIKDYTVSSSDVIDVTIPLAYLSIKPFNSKAGNLLYGKT